MAEQVKLRTSAVRFPQICVYCCAPATEEKEVKLKTKWEDKVSARRIRVQERVANFTVPYCERHKKTADRVQGLLQGVVSLFALLCVVVVIVNKGNMGLFDDMVESPFWGWVLHVLFSLFLGALVGTALGGLLAFLLYLVLWPFVKPIRHTSLRVMSPSETSGCSLGFQASFIAQWVEGFEFDFENSEYADRFRELNPEILAD